VSAPPAPAFWWGVATSAHQVDGGTHQNDWARWARAGRVPEAGRACDHWNRFAEDLDRFAALGLNAYRFSLEWSRLEPRPGVDDPEAWDHYRAVVEGCRRRGIEPLVTLSHFTLPAWLADAGGWLAPDAVGRFVRFTGEAARRLGPVRLWCTVNEPSVLAVMGYLRGVWPPGERSLRRTWQVLARLVRAHRAAYRTIKATRPDAWVGLAHHVIRFRPRTPGLGDRFAAALADALFNRWTIARCGPEQDYIGVNYYTCHWADWHRPFDPLPAVDDTRPRTQMGWVVDPEGFYDVLKAVGRHGRPVLVTENGIATDRDEERQAFLVAHLEALARARAEGVDIRGYFYWSAFDNYEWAEGYVPHFGLYAVDPVTLERRERPSARLFSRYAQAGPPSVSGPPAPR
jgi:beta-glucosidase